jgi:hypothetical protein
MSKASYSKQDRAVIVTLRDSGKSWQQTAKEASEKIGRHISDNAARFQYQQEKGSGRPRPTTRAGRAAATKSNKRKGHSLEEFRKTFDVAQKIRDKVVELLNNGGEEYWTDDEFRQLCGVSVQNWRRHAELDEFKDYQFRKPGFHAWAPPSVVEEMKEITGHAGH